MNKYYTEHNDAGKKKEEAKNTNCKLTNVHRLTKKANIIDLHFDFGFNGCIIYDGQNIKINLYLPKKKKKTDCPAQLLSVRHFFKNLVYRRMNNEKNMH